ncbi:MAG: hypothetical protein U0936_22010 [Planctomycetaceae bacterium]
MACIDSQTAKTADQEARSDTTRQACEWPEKTYCDRCHGIDSGRLCDGSHVHDAVAADPLLRQLNQIYPTVERVHADYYRGDLARMVAKRTPV